MELWSKGVRAPVSSPALVGLASLLKSRQDTRKPPPEPPPCVGCGGSPVVETKAEGGADRNRGGAEKLRAYWVRGEGAVKIGWGTPGDFARCVALVEKYMPGRAEGYCNLRHHDAVGSWPGDHKALPVLPGLGGGPWKEGDHPRNPDGPGGGEFRPKDKGEQGVADRRELTDDERSKVKELIDELTDGGNRQDLTDAQRKAIKAMIDRAVEPTDNRSDAPPVRPFQGLTDAQRGNMRSLVDDMSGDGRFKDLPPHTREAILTGVRGLIPEAKVYTPVTHTPIIEYKAGGANAMPDGVMVALYAPEEVARQGLPDGTPPTDMHVTLAYLGKVGEVPDPGPLHDVVAALAADTAPIDATISGIGRFSGDTPDGDPVYLSVDAPDLAAFRQKLVDALDAAGVPARTDHGFTPHMTVAYIPPKSDTPIRRQDPTSTQFGLLSMAYGPDVWDYPMGATQ